MNYQFSDQLDQDKLAEFYDADPIMALGVFEVFVEETAPAIPILHALYESGNQADFRKMLHKLKPGFLYVGLTGLFQQLSDLELKCDGGSALEELRPLYIQVRRDLTTHLPLVENELSRLRAFES